LKKRQGVRIEWEYAGVDWATQKPLILASGDLPDVFFSSSLTESDVISNRELFIPLDELIEKYGVNIKAMFQDDPGMKRLATAYDGKIWGLPQKMPKRPSTYQVWGINTDWLNKLGLRMPTTTEELYTVLKAFKEKDPNGNGIADEIPASFLGADEANMGIFNFLAPFGVVSSDATWLSVTNGKVQYIVAQEGFKDAVIYLHRLYSEGLLDQELFTQNNNTYFAKGNPPQGQPEIVGMAGRWGRSYLFGTERAKHYGLMLPLKGPRGHQYWRYNPEEAKTGKYYFEITKNCKLPEIAIRWADALYDESTSLELFFGPLGQTFVQNPGGGYTWLAQPADFKGNWAWNFALNGDAPGFTSDTTSDKIVNQWAIDDEQYNDKKLLEPYFPKEWWPPVAFNQDELNELSILRTDIHSISQQKFAQWITRGGVEREYDDLVKQLNTMGLPRMLEIYQNAYNRYMGK
jgi:putative aldouronate transport system substrate-binding protein